MPSNIDIRYNKHIAVIVCETKGVIGVLIALVFTLLFLRKRLWFSSSYRMFKMTGDKTKYFAMVWFGLLGFMAYQPL